LCVICITVDLALSAVCLRLPVSLRQARELRCFCVFDRHDLADGGVVCVEHVVQDASYVCDFAGGKGGCELREVVAGIVDERVYELLADLVARGPDFVVEEGDFRVHGLYHRGEVGLRYVSFCPWPVRICEVC
jgi:hypothetical protein